MLRPHSPYPLFVPTSISSTPVKYVRIEFDPYRYPSPQMIVDSIASERRPLNSSSSMPVEPTWTHASVQSYSSSSMQVVAVARHTTPAANEEWFDSYSNSPPVHSPRSLHVSPTRHPSECDATYSWRQVLQAVRSYQYPVAQESCIQRRRTSGDSRVGGESIET